MISFAATAFVLVLLIFMCACFPNKEGFRNILPTELIDPDYVNINNNPYNYRNFMTVGDVYGPDLNCNNVSSIHLLEWIKQYNPHILHQYVYRYDPSINIYNPNHTPRVLKMLLRNLPELHKYRPILQRCLYKKVDV